MLRFPFQPAAAERSAGPPIPTAFPQAPARPLLPDVPRYPRSAAQPARLSPSEEPEAATGLAEPALPARQEPQPRLAPPQPSQNHPRCRQRGDPAAAVPGPPRVLRAGSGAVTPGDARHGGAAAAAPSPREPDPRAGTRGGGEGNTAVTVVSDDGRCRSRGPALPLPGAGSRR